MKYVKNVDVQEISEVVEVGEKPKGKAMRKNPGCRSRKEFHAQERLAMIKKIKKLQKAVREKFKGRSEKQLKILENRSIRLEYPQLKRSSPIGTFLNREERCRRVVQDNSLGKGPTNPSS